MNKITRRVSNQMAVLILVLGLLGTAAATGCSKARDDAAIKSDIQSRFYADQGLKATNLQVVVTHGQVMLTGQVPSQELRDRAVKLAGATGGVKLVEDRITLAQPAPAKAVAEPYAPTPKAERARPRRKPRVAREYRPKPQPKPPVQESAPARTESQPAQAQAPTEPTAPPPVTAQQEAAPQPQQVTIPQGTHLSVRTIQAIDSSKAKAGQLFRASLDEPVIIDGQTVVPDGADITIRLATAKTAGRMTGTSELELQLVKLTAWGYSYSLTSNVYAAKGKSRGKDTAKKVGVGAAIGAVIGAIAGGGKGAAIGAATGAGAGTAVQLATRGQQVKVPSETLLDFELQRPVNVTVPPQQP